MDAKLADDKAKTGRAENYVYVSPRGAARAAKKQRLNAADPAFRGGDEIGSVASAIAINRQRPRKDQLVDSRLAWRAWYRFEGASLMHCGHCGLR
jgi:hypothetical protein